ncbi:MAG TPA: GGDEF domain-containing protein [Candidatus Mcinerneyibacteriales bacterium]|nr:GGDEF domain-containing protein [Candidatus Mcinerneyibacteriales bacterium]HPJ69438.1 GGDEF domain-containing protein [Candidatus Mcinerneyibacteriales bacterium]HPQ89156.1 GGDEF domain-containing protein [Candidatus Mcinerneyibacteriales bacterium]
MPHSLHEFMNKLNRATSHEEMLSGIMDSAIHQLHLAACAISLKKGTQFKVKISRGYSSHFQRHYNPCEEDPPFSRLPGCAEGLLFTDGGPFPEKKGDHLFLFPLQFKGSCLGFSAMARSAPFTEEEIMTFENLSILAAFILHDELLEEKLRHNSIFDEATGAYNAFYFKLKIIDALGYLERYGHGFAVLGLKYRSTVSLKRLYGNLRVTESLRLLTGKIRSIIRNIDIPARFEESTFLILLRSPQEAAAAELAERVVTAVDEGLKEAGIEARMDYALLFIEEKTSYKNIIQSLEEALDESERTRGLVIAYP